MEILSKCGYRCDLCLAYRPNVAAKDQRKTLSNGWFLIYGFRKEPEEIVCDGCASEENPKLIDTGCPVRPCVIEKKLNNCSECFEYICEKLEQRVVIKEEIEKKLGRNLSDLEYHYFVMPYESKDRLDKLKNNG